MLYKLCRLYFNRRNDPEGVWSVDAGHGTEELKANRVVIRGGIPATTQLDPTKHGDDASAWIELIGVRIERDRDGGIVIWDA